jgi:hypothetical protein
MNRTLTIFSLLIGMLTCAIVSAGQAVGPVVFQVGPDLQKRYLSPAPGPGVTKQSKQAVIGRGKTSIDTGDPKNMFWSEPADLSGAGTVVNADMLWDASSKIFYAFAHASLRCTHGKTAEADVLIGIYGKRNILSKTQGSGWWVVELAQNQCQAPLAGLYGCKFDPQGNNLACGRAELDPRLNDMAIVEATQF